MKYDAVLTSVFSHKSVHINKLEFFVKVNLPNSTGVQKYLLV